MALPQLILSYGTEVFEICGPPPTYIIWCLRYLGMQCAFPMGLKAHHDGIKSATVV